jgi:hypothetical protein
MTRLILCGIAAFAFIAAPAPASATKPVVPSGAAPAVAEDCATRIQKLEASEAEGAERLAAKWEVVGFCDKEFKRDKTVQALVKECTKYLEQPVIKQLLVTDCQLAAYSYGSALRFLKAEYRK